MHAAAGSHHRVTVRDIFCQMSMEPAEGALIARTLANALFEQMDDRDIRAERELLATSVLSEPRNQFADQLRLRYGPSFNMTGMSSVPKCGRTVRMQGARRLRGRWGGRAGRRHAEHT